MARLSKNKKGFTLIELIVYIALVAGVAIIATNTILVLNRTLGTLRLERRLAASAETALRRVSRELNLANDVYASSTLNATPGVLSLKSRESETDAAPKDVMFYLSAGALTLRRATSSALAITASGVTVTNLVFREILNAAASKSVKIELTLRAASGNASTTRNYYLTKVLRGSY